MGVMARDLSLTDLSLRKVFETMQEAGAMAKDTAYQRNKIVDESYLDDSRK
jgi:hypothetical protein